MWALLRPRGARCTSVPSLLSTRSLEFSHSCGSWALPELFPRHTVPVDSPPPFGKDISSGRQNMPPPHPYPAPCPLPWSQSTCRIQSGFQPPSSFSFCPSWESHRAQPSEPLSRADSCLHPSFLCLCLPSAPRPPAHIIPPSPQLCSPAPHLLSPLSASTSFLSQTLREREREKAATNAKSVHKAQTPHHNHLGFLCVITGPATSLV